MKSVKAIARTAKTVKTNKKSADDPVVIDNTASDKKSSYKQILNNLKWITINSNIKLNYLAGINRAIIPIQVTKLAKSLELIGVIRPIVIAEISFLTGKAVKYIIDGQHLFNALIRLGWDIPYVTIQVKDKQDLVEKIALLNSSSKTWSIQDYVTAWSSLKPDYVKLNHYFQVYDIELSMIAAVLSNNSNNGSNISRIIKSGKFNIKNEKDNVEILNYVTDMLKVVPRMNRYENKYACNEFVKFVRNSKCYDQKKHDKFIAQLTKNKEKFILATQAEGKLSDLFFQLLNSKN